VILADTSVWVEHFRRGMLDFAAALENGHISIHAVIEAQRLHGRGIGWSDVQLLVSARLSGDLLWSLDERLAAVAVGLGVAYADRQPVAKDLIKARERRT
jgi:hypothetical protein